LMKLSLPTACLVLAFVALACRHRSGGVVSRSSGFRGTRA
jgi:hypothetical protein